MSATINEKERVVPADFVSAFAPAARAPLDVIRRQVGLFVGLPHVTSVLNAIPEIVIILNAERQIVFANDGISALVYPHLDVLGLRSGEALRCAHSDDTAAGCGTTEFCRTCGAARATLSALRGRPDVQECRIVRSGGLAPLDLRVWATPLTVEKQLYTIFTALDISDEKRRHALERIFFHDVLNAAGGLSGYAQLLSTASPEELVEFHEAINTLAGTLVEEIQAQRELMMAEQDELATQAAPLDTLDALGDVVSMYRRHDVAREKVIEIEPSAEQLIIQTDGRLLRRVLGNMVKNACEATPPGGVVHLGCTSTGAMIEFQVRNQSFMPRDVQLQIFQRSFTTKGNGRGLGTYSMKLLGERYLQGELRFETSEEDGTTFFFRLPRERSEDPGAARRRPS